MTACSTPLHSRCLGERPCPRPKYLEAFGGTACWAHTPADERADLDAVKRNDDRVRAAAWRLLGALNAIRASVNFGTLPRDIRDVVRDATHGMPPSRVSAEERGAGDQRPPA